MPGKTMRGKGPGVRAVDRARSALTRAEKLGEATRDAGFDWRDVHGVLAKVREELDETEAALDRDDLDAAAEEIGDMMLALANVPRFIGRSAEDTLHRACDKFIRRFRQVEALAAKRGLDLRKLSDAETDALWIEAKRIGV